jgi:hypothetical protein
VTEARIRTVFGEIRFTYETGEQLDKILSRIPGDVAAIARTARSLAPRPEAAATADTGITSTRKAGRGRTRKGKGPRG